MFNKEVQPHEMQMRGFPITLKEALEEAENSPDLFRVEFYGEEHPFSDELPLVSSLEEADTVHITRMGTRGSYLSVFYVGDREDIAPCWFLTEEKEEKARTWL